MFYLNDKNYKLSFYKKFFEKLKKLYIADLKIDYNEIDNDNGWEQLKFLTKKDQNLIVLFMLEEYWKKEIDWSNDFEHEPCLAISLFFQIIPIKKIDPRLKDFIIGNLPLFLERANKEYHESKEWFPNHVDYPEKNIALITHLFNLIHAENLTAQEHKEIAETLSTITKSNNFPNSILTIANWMLKSESKKEVLTRHFDHWAKITNEKFNGFTPKKKDMILKYIGFAKNNYNRGKIPNDKWQKKYKEFYKNEKIKFSYLLEIIETLEDEIFGNDWYWYKGRNINDFVPSYVISYENEKTLKILCWMFAACKEDPVLIKLGSCVKHLIHGRKTKRLRNISTRSNVIARAIIWSIAASKSPKKIDILDTIKSEATSNTIKSFINSQKENK